MNFVNFPAPDIKPLERLNVYDSLMINAQRWSLAHAYHRQRQNVHYQSLNQPGIVCGLGITIIDPPDSTESRFRDQRWIEIQPGIAIDVEGNVIIVDEAVDRTYRIAAKPPIAGSITVYVVVSYVEPEAPSYQPHSEVLREQFRFDQKTTPPKDHEIELCRIQLSNNFIQIERPDDVLFPVQNQLDMSHRLQAQTKPIATAHLAQIKPQSTEAGVSKGQAVTFLARSTSALYPSLQGIAAPNVLSLQAEAIAPYDLLLLDADHVSELSGTEQDVLSEYLTQGGMVLIELLDTNEFAIANFQNWIEHSFQTALESWHELSNDHPVRSHPFLFAALPEVDQTSIQVWCGGGIIFVAGGLSSAWAPDVQGMRSRNDIRTAQEFGINLLHFAWRRRHLTQLLQPALS
ncbi:DUF4159 domain-containing protein [Leptolyngbya sp. FACHB-16]|nr:DUF4159 domain-containing protein [Leptolyngbya sp. FACHB-16]MBD1909340.1 DUF4159 domain-containing protein [Leptolyngbya sp. FACHB-8]MBD2158198.1 DUF4159 domain-containing protein [Leptolyngbya sp. FACHB-16]